MLQVAANPIDAFLDYLTIECGLSVNTLQAYQRDLERFAAFADAQRPADWERVTGDRVIEFLMSEKARGCAVSTVSRALSTAKVLSTSSQRARIESP